MNLQTVSYFLDKPVFLLTEKYQINRIAHRFVTGRVQVQTSAVGRVGSPTNESVNLASGLHKMFAMTAWKISAHNKNESLFEQIYESQSPVNQDVFEVGLHNSR